MQLLQLLLGERLLDPSANEALGDHTQTLSPAVGLGHRHN